MAEDTNEHLGSSDGSSRKNTAAWLRIMAALSSDDGKPHPTMMEAANTMERMREALIRIMVWADHDCVRGESRRKAMDDIAKACREALEQ